MMADELTLDVMREGKDDVTKHGQRVTVHYQGRVSDNTIFDASRARGHLWMGTRCYWHESWVNATSEHSS